MAPNPNAMQRSFLIVMDEDEYKMREHGIKGLAKRNTINHWQPDKLPAKLVFDESWDQFDYLDKSEGSDIDEDAEPAGLARSWNPTVGKQIERPTKPTEPTLPNQLLTEMETSNSYFSAEFSTIQPLDHRRSLLILAIRCHPAPKRRFVNVTLVWKVAGPTVAQVPINYPRPKITHLAPEFSAGDWSEEWKNFVWSITVPIQAGFMGSSIGVQPSATFTSQKVVNHAMTISGSKRTSGTRCVWTVEENKGNKRGVPSHFQLAMVVEHVGPFDTEIDVKAELGGGLWPQYMKVKGEGLATTISVEEWKCGEILWDSGEDGWKNFMKAMTGEVQGVVRGFGQETVHL